MKGSVLDKKRDTWYFSFDLGKDPFTGKRRQIKRRRFKTEKEAENALIKIQSKMINNDFLDLTQMSYSKYLDEYGLKKDVFISRSRPMKFTPSTVRTS